MRTSLPAYALALCALTLCTFSAGCDRTVTVDVNPGGAQKLALHGIRGGEGELLRPIKYGATTVPAGTRVRVMETWLLRKNKKTKPPGYRIGGLWDATQQNDGLMLPRHAVDTYFFASVLPELTVEVVVPERWFKQTP